MMKSLSVFFISLICFFSVFGQEAVVDISLSPAGSFKAKTQEVSGTVSRQGDVLVASNIVVKLSQLDTGIELRNEHTREYLKVSEFPEAILLHAQGSQGKGSGRIKIMGQEKDIQGTYTVDGKMLRAKFPLSLKEFGITGIRYMGVGVKDQITVNVTLPVLDK